jgi:hypothetical protein
VRGISERRAEVVRTSEGTGSHERRYTLFTSVSLASPTRVTSELTNHENDISIGGVLLLVVCSTAPSISSSFSLFSFLMTITSGTTTALATVAADEEPAEGASW